MAQYLGQDCGHGATGFSGARSPRDPHDKHFGGCGTCAEMHDASAWRLSRRLQRRPTGPLYGVCADPPPAAWRKRSPYVAAACGNCLVAVNRPRAGRSADTVPNASGYVSRASMGGSDRTRPHIGPQFAGRLAPPSGYRFSRGSKRHMMGNRRDMGRGGAIAVRSRGLPGGPRHGASDRSGVAKILGA